MHLIFDQKKSSIKRGWQGDLMDNAIFYFFLLKPSLMMSVRPDLVTVWPASTRCSSTRSPATVSASSLGPGLVHVDMSSDIVREESFRTALRNQKRRLSATEKKPVEAALGGFQSGVNKSVLNNLKTRDSLTPPRRDFLTPPRNSFTPPRWENTYKQLIKCAKSSIITETSRDS